MSTFSELLKKIKTTQELANREADEFGVQVRAGWTYNIEVAKRELEPLNKQLKDAVTNMTVVVLPTNFKDDSVCNKFYSLLSETDATVARVNTSSLYSDIANAVWSSMGKEKIFTSTQFALFASEIKLLASNLGILHELNFTESYQTTVIETKEHMASFVKDLVRKSNKELFTEQLLKNKLVEFCLQNDVKDDKIFLCLLGTDIEERDALSKIFTKRSPVDLGTKKLNFEFVNDWVKTK